MHLHCAYQPSGAPHGHGLDDVELQTLCVREKREAEMDKAEVWLKRGTSRENLRSVREEEDVLGTKTLRG